MANNVVIKMDGGTSNGDSIATIDVPDDGLIMASKIMIQGQGFTSAASFMRGELSFASTNSFDSNDIRSVFAYIHLGGDDIQTAENNVGHHESDYHYPDGIRVFAGERIHMHTGLNVASFGECIAMIVFRFKTFTARRR